MTDRSVVTLYVPPLGTVAAPALLARRLRRARVVPDGRDAAARRAALFGLSAAAGLAAVARVGEGARADDAWWVRCDPVHLGVYGNRLLLTDPGILTLTAGEAQQLTALLNPLFADEGGHIEPLAPLRWYLTLPQPPLLRATAITQIAGCNVNDYLPEGDHHYWRQRLNEAQMLLHQVLPNAHGGEAQGVAVNSIWFWGPGYAPSATQVPYSALYTDDVIARGAARLAGVAVYDLPADGTEMEWHGDCLIALPEAMGTAVGGPAVITDVLTAVVQRWIEPLQAAVAAGQVGRGIVIGDAGPQWCIDRGDRWRFWRRGL